jgi:predicted negative regulator of RcsB-dependent stress response
MDRQHRHDLKHDKFVDELGALSQRARKNQRMLLALAGGVVATAVIIYGIFFYRSYREDNAQQQLYVALETFDASVGELPADQPPPTGPQFKTDEERLAAAEPLFNNVRSSYSGTDASDVAALYLAHIATLRNDVAKARGLLQEFISSQKNHMLTGTARYSLYQLRIEAGEVDQVVNELNAELAKAEPVLPGDSLLVLLAAAYEAKGDRAKSLEAYRRITTEFPESPYALDAQRRVGTQG